MEGLLLLVSLFVILFLLSYPDAAVRVGYCQIAMKVLNIIQIVMPLTTKLMTSKYLFLMLLSISNIPLT
jgi:hypothetical protein